MASDVTVGIDIGTTSVKAVAAAGDGTVLARARVPHEVRVPEPGSFEHDVDRVWRDGVLAALGQVAGAGEAGYWPAQAVANHALCGRGAIDTTTATTAHPLFDFAAWDAQLAAEAGV